MTTLFDVLARARICKPFEEPRNRFPDRRARARICKRLWSPKIVSEESIQLAYVAWRAGTTNRVVVPARQAGNRFQGSLKGLQIRAQYDNPVCRTGPPGYTGWRNRFIGIDTCSINIYKYGLWLHRLAESIPSYLIVYNFGRWCYRFVYD